jgi:hypothetical protein
MDYIAPVLRENYEQALVKTPHMLKLILQQIHAQ